MAQCLVEQMDGQLDRGYQLPEPRAWVVRENKWRAARYGLDAEIVVDARGTVRPVRAAIHELVDDSAGCGDVAVLAPERQPVAAESDRAMKPLAQRVEDAVLNAGELGRNLVRYVQHLLHRRSVGTG